VAAPAAGSGPSAGSTAADFPVVDAPLVLGVALGLLAFFVFVLVFVLVRAFAMPVQPFVRCCVQTNRVNLSDHSNLIPCASSSLPLKLMVVVCRRM
jgi:hypothetical protein